MVDFIPVDNDPFAQAGPKLQPVDHDPFAKPGFVGRMGQVASGMVQNLTAGMQGTSPYMADAQGKPTRQKLGKLVQSDIGPTYEGSWDPLDPSKHVVLNDPETGVPTVFTRGSEDEGTISSLGRMAGAGLLAGPITGARAVASLPNKAQGLAADFKKVGVAPILPALTGGRGSGTVAQVIRNVPVAGDLTVGKGMTRMLDQTADATQRAASGYGQGLDPAIAGRMVQEAARDFKRPFGEAISLAEARSRPTSQVGFGNKASALYEELGRLVPQGVPIPMGSTMAALNRLTTKFPSNPKFGETLQNSLFSKWGQTLKEGGALTYPEVKEFRRLVGDRLADPKLATDVPQAELRAVYGALSDDMTRFAESVSPEAGKAAKEANAYFAAGMNRAENALQPVADAAGEGAFRQVINAASTGGAADIMKAYQIKRSMKPEQWSEVASSYIAQLGKSADQAGNEVFSLPKLITSYGKLSPAGKDLLFSGKGMAKQREMLDSLVRVAGAQQKVERLGNPSGTARQGLTIAAAAATVADPISTIGVALGASGTGALLSSPRFANWFVRAKTVGKSGLAKHAAELSALAKAEPQFASQYLSLQRSLADEER